MLSYVAEYVLGPSPLKLTGPVLVVAGAVHGATYAVSRSV